MITPGMTSAMLAKLVTLAGVQAIDCGDLSDADKATMCLVAGCQMRMTWEGERLVYTTVNPVSIQKIDGKFHVVRAAPVNLTRRAFLQGLLATAAAVMSPLPDSVLAHPAVQKRLRIAELVCGPSLTATDIANLALGKLARDYDKDLVTVEWYLGSLKGPLIRRAQVPRDRVQHGVGCRRA